MDGGAAYNPRTVEEVFRDFKGRRAGMIKALTTGLSLSLSLKCFLFFLFLILNSFLLYLLVQMLMTFISSVILVS